MPYSNHINPNPNSNSLPKKKHRGSRPAEESPEVAPACSDDAYSYNQASIDRNGANPNFNPGSYISFDLSTCTKSELVQIRKRFASELDSVKRLNLQIDSGKFNTQKKRKLNPTAPMKDSKNSKKLYQQLPALDAAEMENLMKMCKQVLGKLMKHKLSWVFNKPVDAAALGLHDYHHIIKRPMDLGTVKSNLGKGFYSSPADFAADVRLTFNNAMLYNPQGDEVHKMADQMLSRFEELYGPIGLKYKVDNIKIDELHGSSSNVSPPQEKPKKPKSKSKPLPLPLPVAVPMSMPVAPPTKSEKMEFVPNQIERIEISPKKSEKKENASKKSDRTETVAKKIESLPDVEMVPNLPPSPPVQQQIPMRPAAGRGSSAKLPKPRAKDPNKRAMSMEEKHKLSVGLQSLPDEKMVQLVHIIKKRNAHMVQEGDEIELDIDAIDTETLWELDRFVTNWKKLVSKTKRQALMTNANSASAFAETETASGEDNAVSASERTEVEKNPKEDEGVEDDVDIGDADDVPMSSFMGVEIEKDDNGHRANENENENENEINNGAAAAASSSSSSSGSSSSDTSSSSDSDSGSSSGSDSDVDDAQTSKQRVEE